MIYNPFPGGLNMKFKKEAKKEILNNYRKGLKIKDICDKYGVKKSTLFLCINKEKIMSKREKRLLNTTKEYKTLEIAYNKLKTEYAILNDAFISLNLDLNIKLSVSRLNSNFCTRNPKLGMGSNRCRDLTSPSPMYGFILTHC